MEEEGILPTSWPSRQTDRQTGSSIPRRCRFPKRPRYFKVHISTEEIKPKSLRLRPRLLVRLTRPPVQPHEDKLETVAHAGPPNPQSSR